jgi:hypothetical protein
METALGKLDIKITLGLVMLRYGPSEIPFKVETLEDRVDKKSPIKWPRYR